MTEEIINCDFYNEKICTLFSKYFGFNVECENLSLCTVDDDTEKECPYKQLKRLEQECDELKKTVENQKLEYEELQCDLSEVENACGCYQSENAELKQENKELESQRDEARIAYNNLILDIVSDIPFEGEIGGERFISIKDRLHQMQKALASLEKIKEIVTNAFAKQRPYKEDFTEIENIINEVLNLS